MSGTTPPANHCPAANFQLGVHEPTRSSPALCREARKSSTVPNQSEQAHDPGGPPSSRTATTHPSSFLAGPSNMSLSCRYAAQRCARQLRSGASLRPSTVTRIASTPRRYNSTEAQAATPENPKIAAIVDQISQLTLLETADLVSSLKVIFPPFCSSRRSKARCQHLTEKHF